MARIAHNSVWIAALSLLPLDAGWAGDEVPTKAPPVSYYEQIRPIFQARCQGCHQPAKPRGDFVMTSVSSLLAGGDSEMAAVVPKKPDESYLIEQITPVDGEAEMPRKGPPLREAEIDLIRRWIAEGALDDTPEGAAERYDAEHPPTYDRPPAITSLDYSPDGELLAVAGFHEVLLHKADGSGLVARLIGMSERIEAVRFSPDGKKLAVTGGSPARMGEVQVWDVAERKLTLSVPVTFDTVFGASWSPDQRLIAFGCTDNTVRAINARTGEQVLNQGAHKDWVFDTVFGIDGRHLVSVGRDMTAKLIDVKTQQFVENITSITPRGLKGGISSVVRHPLRDEILFGGADGVPRIYRMHPETERKTGDDANLLWELPGLPGRVFAVDISQDGTKIAAGSSLDGKGAIHIYAMAPDPQISRGIKKILFKPALARSAIEVSRLEKHFAEGIQIVAEVPVPGGGVYAVSFSPDGQRLAAAGSDGRIRLIDASTGAVVTEFDPVDVTPEPRGAHSLAADDPPDYIRDVMPVLSRLGCNAGTCHGSRDGKNGFKLSLRGYDPIFDVRALTDDMASRRVNVASPDNSLMLLKPTAAVPHEGGQVTTVDSKYYRILRGWIAGGAGLNLESARVASLELYPVNPVVQRIGSRQQIRVVATYTDGSQRDVTAEAFVESGNSDIVVPVDGKPGLVAALRRGEAPILVRFEGAYAATTFTVMGNRQGFVWQEPPSNNPIDGFVAAKLKRTRTLSSPLCDDYEFVRRAHLDLTGLPPTVERIREFVSDRRDSRWKRDELVDQLVGSPAFVEHWTNKWADLLQVNRKFLGPDGAAAFRNWIREEVAQNTRYDEFVRKLLTATGSNRENPAASYFKILRDPQETMENTTHLFLATRFKCNKCHDHPFERWTQDQYYQLAAYFAQVGLKKDPASGKKEIDKNAVEKGKPVYEIVFDKAEGEVTHVRTGQVVVPGVPYPARHEALAQDASRRQQLAAWITSADNRYFARSYVNRLWGYLTGVGIIEPIDDIRAGNPPTNPELLDWLTEQFLASDFDARYMIELICKSRTYQLSIETNRWNEDDEINYSHARARRLPAEVLYDTIHAVIGAPSKFPGVPEGTRAAALPDAGVTLPDGFLASLGRPARESACECERSNDLHLGPVMALVSGPTVGDALADANNDLEGLVNRLTDDRQLVSELFLRILNRPAAAGEVSAALDAMAGMEAEHQAMTSELAEAEERWAPKEVEVERRRRERIEKAEGALAAYRAELQPRLDQLGRERQARVERAEAAIADYEESLSTRLAKWKDSSQRRVEWIPLDPHELTATHGATLKKQPDLSIIVSGKQGRGNYELTAESNLKAIRGIRIEALTDESLPNNGPGRADDGGFVLSEFKVRWADAASRIDDQDFEAVELTAAQADFSEKGHDVSEAIDKLTPSVRNGWAIAPRTGEAHTAVFKVKDELKSSQGAILKLSFVQNFNTGQHALGRFRVSVTDATGPLDLGLPADIQRILEVASASLSDPQRQRLTEFFRGRDGELKKRRQELAAARKPLPKDEKLTRLEQRLAEAQKPIAIDPYLARLRREVKTSERQLGNKRLTAAQDISWALINNPEFLFNH